MFERKLYNVCKLDITKNISILEDIGIEMMQNKMDR